MQQALTLSERLIAVLGARLGLRFFRRRDMLETLDAPQRTAMRHRRVSSTPPATPVRICSHG